jgi:outer membrane protein
VAQASRERLSGSGDFGSASNTQRQQMIGLSLNVPLYTGGWRNAKEQEALRLEDKARAEVERTRQQVGQLTRAAWLGLQSGQARLLALEEALTAQQARLDATRLGRQLGDRTTLDLLNAENDASAAELALLQARIDTLQNRLRLDALVGQLDAQRLQAVNNALQP